MNAPLHVAIIPDGNRRWAKAKGLAATAGHEKSSQYPKLKSLLNAAKEMGVKYLSAWAFSTENWKRSEAENTFLFKLLRGFLSSLKDDAVKEGVRVRWRGRRDRVPKDIAEQLVQLEDLTKDCEQITFQLCLDYGGRDELVRAINKAVAQGKDVTEESFRELLDEDETPDPDLIIRTSGEKRLSGFMPWQATYAELYFTDKHFPDFGPDDLKNAIKDFMDRHRRFGAG